MEMGKIINRKMRYDISDKEALSKSLSFIEDSLSSCGTPHKLIIRTMIIAEETIVSFIENCDEDGNFTISVRRFLGDAAIFIRS